MDDLARALEIVSQFGSTALFLWLFLREMVAHERTRQQYLEDLREIAGMRANLSQTRESLRSES